MSRWIHFSGRPLVSIESREQPELIFSCGKPNGLWVSDEDAEQSWSSWCRDEGYMDTTKQTAHLVTLRDDANVLRITNDEGMFAFVERYLTHDKYGEGIDWSRVALDHGGLLITPYMWQHRLDMMWYYGWDCASGCIWDPAAVANIEALTEAQR